jgi:transcriptional regulator with XRE-family HTH domain
MIVGFPEQLAKLRHDRGLTQAALAERIGVRANQISLYESGRSEPSLGALRQLAVALSVTSDALIFGDERLGDDQALQLAFEATVLLEPDERTSVQALLEAFLASHEKRRSAGEGPRARKKPLR